MTDDSNQSPDIRAVPEPFEYNPSSWKQRVRVCLVAACALGSYRRSLFRLHLVSVPAALWLIGAGFALEGPPAPPELQNSVAVGLLLGIFAIVPSRAGEPPRRWSEFHARSARTN